MSDIQDLASQFKSQCEQSSPNVEQCYKLLNELKRKFVTLKPLQPGATIETDEDKKLFFLVREVLEYAACLNIKQKDLEAFERNFAMLKNFYFDYLGVEKSSRHHMLLGLNLLQLLSQNRIADFHTELERIPVEEHDQPHIKQAIQLELYLMEGSYTKLRNAHSSVSDSESKVLLEVLMETVREEIADCSEKAYKFLTLQQAAELLMFSSENDLKEYASSRGWGISNGLIHFGKDQSKDDTLHTHEVILETLSYAKELERII
eukprot:gb/GECH01009907.1/.p1 GENE.gb/GECH01009907.1/~~gb/GECH01009907.1/.p1  ORF type:complete len:262 (+),score=68.39 gb/GECH01009907.1/:1-786(+)